MSTMHFTSAIPLCQHKTGSAVLLLGGQVERGEAVDVIPHIHHGASGEKRFGHRGVPVAYLRASLWTV